MTRTDPEAEGVGVDAQNRRGANNNLLRQHDLAMALGVTDKRIATWRSRSRVNGFPAPIAMSFGPHARGGKRRHYLWDFEEVSEWFQRYDEKAQRARGGWRQRDRTWSHTEGRWLSESESR